MVLESILRPKNAEDKPWHVFAIAFIYTFISIFFAYKLFPEQSSILTIALITIIFVPFFQRLFVFEEKKDELVARRKMKRNLFARHGAVISVFSMFFLGIVVAMSLAFVFVPEFKDVFVLQSETLRGFSSAATAQATGSSEFATFFYNNTQVMILMFILSAMLGAGAVFILAWNASVIAVYVGLFVQSLIGKGLSSGVAYLYGLPVSLGSIALHGIPEIVAYFFAGIAGGILSVGILREKFNSKEFSLVFKDSLIFLGIAELLIFVAALVETVF